MSTNKTHDEFVTLLKQNIKNIDIKGEDMMTGFSFPENNLKEKVNNINNMSNDNQKTLQVNHSMSNSQQDKKSTDSSAFSKPAHQANQANQVNQVNQVNQTQPKPIVHQSGLSASDFEKLKEDLISRVDLKIEEIGDKFQEKINSFDESISNLNAVAERLANSSTTYYEINNIIERLQEKNISSLSDIENKLTEKVSNLKSIIENEIKKTDNFVDELMAGATKKKSSSKRKRDEDEDEDEDESTRKTTKYNEYEDEDEDESPRHKVEKYDEDEDEDEDEDDAPKKKKKKKKQNDDDDDVFVKNKNSKPVKKSGLMGSLFSKLGL